jgi:hypothetical protein
MHVWLADEFYPAQGAIVEIRAVSGAATGILRNDCNAH